MSIERDLRQLNANINNVVRKVKAEGVKAINKIAAKAMKEATKSVAKDIGVPVKTIRGRARLMQKAKAVHPAARIRVNRTHMPAIRLFENRSNKMWIGRGGIIIGKYAVQRGFIQTLANGRRHVMQREGRARYGIDVVKIPVGAPLTAAFNHSLRDYPQQLQHELKAAFHKLGA